MLIPHWLQLCHSSLVKRGSSENRPKGSRIHMVQGPSVDSIQWDLDTAFMLMTEAEGGGSTGDHPTVHKSTPEGSEVTGPEMAENTWVGG